jgi:tRNA (mo5U34)-methyltransferase
MGVALPRDLFWYHSIELGGGLVTPGVYDLRDKWHHYHFPADFQGQRMLDIGAATGFFSFRFAQSGAEVVATELGDIGGLDRFPGQDLEIVAQKAAKYAQGYVLEPPAVWDAHTLHHLMLEGPFFYCQQVLGLTLERVFSRIYDLSPDTVGRFDWVFIGDVLLHTLRPLEALSAAASVCEGTLVIAQELTALGGDTPLLVYTGGSELDDDESAWWMPNLAWMKQLLHKLGFRTVEVKAVFEDVYLPVGQVLTRTVIHAKR